MLGAPQNGSKKVRQSNQDCLALAPYWLAHIKKASRPIGPRDLYATQHSHYIIATAPLQFRSSTFSHPYQSCFSLFRLSLYCHATLMPIVNQLGWRNDWKFTALLFRNDIVRYNHTPKHSSKKLNCRLDVPVICG